MPRKRRVPKYGDFCRPRNGVKKQLKPLSPKHGFAISHSGEVTAGVREIFHDPKPDRIRHEGEHDRDRQVGGLECEHRRRSDRDDDIRPLRSDLCDKSI